ncbi:MAG TPA: DUF4129 domain-containing protein [Acidobacteriaceae bacterium]|nr:DUF4129 domain-containing protein [Acidobacteriaceae bacterium]
MILSLRQTRRLRQRPALALAFALSISFAAYAPAENQPPPAADTGPLSPAQYQAKLQSLQQLLAACRQALTPAACPSSQVGPDLKVALPMGVRQVRLAWFRELLDQAAKGQPKPPAPKKPSAGQSQSEPPPDFPPPTLDQRLQTTQQRLSAEEQLATPPAGPSDAASGRRALTQILAAKEYQTAVVRPSLLHRALEKIGNWLDRFFGRLREAGFRSRWIGITAEIAFGLLVCIALAWFLIRLERNGRFAGFHPESPAGAASARDWQLWLADAQSAAAQSAWRDAIHYLYWASISRLESSGLWPADRARTPREYLAMLSGASTERTGLAALTRSFERTWYAGRPAVQSDYLAAEQMAAQLGAKSAAAARSNSGSLQSKSESLEPHSWSSQSHFGSPKSHFGDIDQQ